MINIESFEYKKSYRKYRGDLIYIQRNMWLRVVTMIFLRSKFIIKNFIINVKTVKTDKIDISQCESSLVTRTGSTHIYSRRTHTRFYPRRGKQGLAHARANSSPAY